MANKLSKDISGSVQEKRGMLYLVVSYKDTVTQKNKTKCLGLGLPAGSTKSLINKAVREAKNKFESEYKRFLDGYDDPTKYPLLQFINDWLDRVHIHKIQESTYYGYKRRVSGKMVKYFDEKITLADCKPRLIHGFYDYLREDGDSEQTILHYHNLLHDACGWAVRQEILLSNPFDKVDRPKPKKYNACYYTPEQVQLLMEAPKVSVSSSRSSLPSIADCEEARHLGCRGATSTLRMTKSLSGRKCWRLSATAKWNRWSATR